MEAKAVNIAGDELDMLCAEILENWNSPNLGNSFFIHQNPFSHCNSSSYDDIIQRDTNATHYSPLQPLYCTTNMETKNEGSEHKEGRTMKTTGYEKEEDDDDDSDGEEDNFRIILNPNDACYPPSQERCTAEVKVDRAKIDECLNLAAAKDPSLYDSNVIIEIAIRDSAYEKTPIKGEKILPFPMDSYSDEYLKFDAIKLDMAIDDCLNFADSEDLILHDSDVIIEIVCDKAQPISDSDNTPQHINCRMIKGDKILPFPMDSFTLAKDRHKRPLWRKERDYYSSRQENRKRANKLNDTISPHKIEEDPEKLRRRRERFEVPLPNVKNGVIAVANKPNILNLTTDSDIKDQRPTRTRKWRNS
ncbi:hypothetical protein PHJA_001330800 [Phtheirospermum japonicum]|uniref:Uncharacterized protein n=1 Tax=Phtheirospermum japonicum TaxID=374723 RepID=A0A830C408_9LAMI|nr:hypothetical protein PHJA_001330800 [Phtheirospermum japonicum]